MIKTILDKTGTINKIEVSQNNKYVLLCMFYVKIIHISSLKILRKFMFNKKKNISMSISNDINILITNNFDGNIYIWCVNSG